MASMIWNESLSVGVKALDDDHKKLVEMINEMLDGILNNRRQEALSQVLGKLVKYTKFHFDREEEYFARTGYAAAPHHISEHQQLIKKVTVLQARFKAGDASLNPLELMQFLKDWLVRHIMEEDKKYKMHLNANGIC